MSGRTSSGAGPRNGRALAVGYRILPGTFEGWTDQAACVDFSGNKGRALVAYRWNGRPSVAQQNNAAAPRWDGERIITVANFDSTGGDLDARTRRR